MSPQLNHSSILNDSRSSNPPRSPPIFPHPNRSNSLNKPRNHCDPTHELASFFNQYTANLAGVATGSESFKQCERLKAPPPASNALSPRTSIANTLFKQSERFKNPPQIKANGQWKTLPEFRSQAKSESFKECERLNNPPSTVVSLPMAVRFAAQPILNHSNSLNDSRKPLLPKSPIQLALRLAC